jgi:lysophospholipase L1-like esterase
MRLVPVLATCAVLMVAVTGCTPTPEPYVALGDSYTAGPLIPNQELTPLGCLRSDHNYPSLIAANLHTGFTDMSCSGAEIKHMTESQGVTPGPNDPQFEALNASTKVVTLQIGGNDIGFSSIVKNCINLNPFATPCVNIYVTSAGDQLEQNIAAAKAPLIAALKTAHVDAPNATIFLLGYPTILPTTGDGCWPTLPILPADVAYLRTVYAGLNSMIASAAKAGGATYIDLGPGTAAHDICSSDPWIAELSLQAAPVHPNAEGMVGIAAIVQPYVKSKL